ncbi:MAG TPA: AgmX/PglI C-terminal domain-containing protein [Polyangia bacterium]
MLQIRLPLPAVIAVALASAACSSTNASSPGYTLIRGDEPASPKGGISPDKEAEVQLVLQQREVSTRKCYQDILNEKQDRNFAGTVRVLISLNTDRTARDVKVIGGTLQDAGVTSCLVDTIKRFEFPELPQAGDVQSEFTFRPAY